MTAMTAMTWRQIYKIVLLLFTVFQTSIFMIRHFLLFAFVLCLIACGEKTNQANTSTTPAATTTAPTAAATKPVTKTAVSYPPLPNNIAQDLYNRCDFVDYIFYDPSLPMSISLIEQSSIRSTFAHIGPEKAMTDGTCKPTGRVMFQHKGEYIIEADFYLRDECTYYIFMVNGKPTYANAMSQAGITFFSNNINSAKKSVQEKLQGK
jgi:hypothetical protein